MWVWVVPRLGGRRRCCPTPHLASFLESWRPLAKKASAADALSWGAGTSAPLLEEVLRKSGMAPGGWGAKVGGHAGGRAGALLRAATYSNWHRHDAARVWAACGLFKSRAWQPRTPGAGRGRAYLRFALNKAGYRS